MAETLNRYKGIFKTLAADFDEKYIERTTSVRTHKGYDTAGIKAQAVADRLNDTLGVGGWWLEVVEKFEQPAKVFNKDGWEVQITVCLHLYDWDVEHKEIAQTPHSYGSHKTQDLGDARKGAMTGAFKKAASWFGIGRNAWLGAWDEDNVPADEMPKQAPPAKQEKPKQPKPELTPAQVEPPKAPIISEYPKKIAAQALKLYDNLKTDLSQQAQFVTYVKELSKKDFPKAGNVSDYLKSIPETDLKKVYDQLQVFVDDTFESVPVYAYEQLEPALKYLNAKE